jgi:hypothetical protein
VSLPTFGVAREDFSERVTLEFRSKGKKGASQAVILGKII